MEWWDGEGAELAVPPITLTLPFSAALVGVEIDCESRVEEDNPKLARLAKPADSSSASSSKSDAFKKRKNLQYISEKFLRLKRRHSDCGDDNAKVFDVQSLQQHQRLPRLNLIVVDAKQGLSNSKCHYQKILRPNQFGKTDELPSAFVQSIPPNSDC